MLLSHEGLLHKGSEFCQAIKFVIKLQISTLLQQLAESGEESVVLTANVLEGTADRLGSLRGTGFLEDHEQLGNQFLSYCAETRRFSVDDEGDNLPARTTRKSSASSKSLDEDVAMLTSQDYSDTPRSLSDSSTTWPPDLVMEGVEKGERSAGSGSRLMLGASYEGQDAEAKYKTQMIQSESAGTKSHQGTEQYSSLTESREYQSELGEIYRLPKKMESKLYHQRNNNGGRKQSKTHVERRCSESMIQNYETSGLFTAFHKDKEILGTETVKLEHDVILQPDISKSFEEAVKIQQSLFQTSLGMFSPIQRQFLQPSRPFPQRERSQSLSEFHTLAQDIPHPSGRARFPSSSFAENLDSPLVIDDDSKPESESREGLDLSNKKRKMSADDIYPMSADDPQEGAGLNAAANQSEEQEFAGGAG
ncbi:hypothetical protein MAR_036178, partial [Mya arenaria]